MDTKLTRIGIFYDGNYFSHVSNYYNYIHSRRSRISIEGLHEFVRKHVSESEGIDIRYCQVVDAHYFRGRFSAADSREANKLFSERLFEDVLMSSGVVTHYLPMTSRGEKGIDVWFSLEALELAMYKRFNVVVLIACDSDYIPLVRKLNTLGIRVMVLGWDFEYTDSNNKKRTTVTSQFLLEEVTYGVLMHAVIDDKTKKNDPYVNNIFVPRREAPSSNSARSTAHTITTVVVSANSSDTKNGKIHLIKEGYGFIMPAGGSRNIFFYYADVLNKDFNDLKVGDDVEYKLGTNDTGECAVDIIAK